MHLVFEFLLYISSRIFLNTHYRFYLYFLYLMLLYLLLERSDAKHINYITKQIIYYIQVLPLTFLGFTIHYIK